MRQPHRIRDFTGQRFGKLIVQRLAEQDPRNGAAHFHCQCDCGKTLIVLGAHLGKPKPQQSCGCLRWERDRVNPNRSNKHCSCCQTDKPIESFNRNASAPDGRGQYCKECRPLVRERYKGERQRKQKREYVRRQAKQSPSYRIARSLRQRVRDVLHGLSKSAPTLELLGCSLRALKAHLEQHFEVGMTWENYGKELGKWHIDHIRPCASFDLTDPEQQQKCFHYANLQPLWAVDNLHKSDKI